jgi:homoserine trans-succinylase
MKINLKTIGIMFLISTLFAFCKKEKDDYYDLSDQEKALLLYNEGDTFSLKHEDSVIYEFTVYEKSIYHKKTSYFDAKKYETGQLKFGSTNNEDIRGAIQMKKLYGDFEYEIYINFSVDTFEIFYEDDKHPFRKTIRKEYTIKNTSFKNVYAFDNKSSKEDTPTKRVLFTLSDGFLLFEDLKRDKEFISTIIE